MGMGWRKEDNSRTRLSEVVIVILSSLLGDIGTYRHFSCGIEVQLNPINYILISTSATSGLFPFWIGTSPPSLCNSQLCLEQILYIFPSCHVVRKLNAFLFILPNCRKPFLFQPTTCSSFNYSQPYGHIECVGKVMQLPQAS